ncbi:hypothetical protein NLI96_g7359 [Meripilus lineatus]|uniref:Uncharacterized protein n=1 Tax=Meripilus lineatus TaxID=2056292 RepID=A0AAD5YF34_9APHY|nr:hypothetical protein NLI96_g7359 [Physisporinus lineatus]
MEMGMIPILSMPVPRVVIPENIPESSEEESPSGGSSTEVGTPDSEKDKKLESVDEFEIQEVPREKVEANV